jgi:hypothetical protein
VASRGDTCEMFCQKLQQLGYVPDPTAARLLSSGGFVDELQLGFSDSPKYPQGNAHQLQSLRYEQSCPGPDEFERVRLQEKMVGSRPERVKSDGDRQVQGNSQPKAPFNKSGEGQQQQPPSGSARLTVVTLNVLHHRYYERFREQGPAKPMSESDRMKLLQSYFATAARATDIFLLQECMVLDLQPLLGRGAPLSGFDYVAGHPKNETCIILFRRSSVSPIGHPVVKQIPDAEGKVSTKCFVMQLFQLAGAPFDFKFSAVSSHIPFAATAQDFGKIMSFFTINKVFSNPDQRRYIVGGDFNADIMQQQGVYSAVFPGNQWKDALSSLFHTCRNSRDANTKIDFIWRTLNEASPIRMTEQKVFSVPDQGKLDELLPHRSVAYSPNSFFSDHVAATVVFDITAGQ